MMIIFACAIAAMVAWPSWSARAAEPREPKEPARDGLVALPLVTFAPETSLAFGAVAMWYFWLDDARPSVVRIDGRYTLEHQTLVKFRPELYRGDHHLKWFNFWERVPVNYYGIGPDTALGNEEAFDPSLLRTQLDYDYRVWQALSLGVAAELQHYSVSGVQAGGELAREAVLGSDGGLTVGAGLIAVWDARDNPNAPRSGRYARLGVIAFSGAAGSDFDYRRYSLDVRQFLRVYGEHVLAFQGLLSMRDGDTPFYDLSQIGGRWMMRGFYEGRYRDDHMLAVQAEYRLPIWWRIGGALFGGAAQVADDLGALDLADPKLAGGAGLRFVLSRGSRLNARLDVGIAQGQTGAYLTFGEAF